VLHPDLAVWMLEEGYGRVLSRPGLAARERERVAVTVLAALGWERQLVSHLIGARRLGASASGIRKSFEIGRKRAPAVGPADRAWAKAASAPLDSR
jgi:4-carboxymuconolactone decarboxylase